MSSVNILRFCGLCGKKETTKGPAKRTINRSTQVCNECENKSNPAANDPTVKESPVYNLNGIDENASQGSSQKNTIEVKDDYWNYWITL